MLAKIFRFKRYFQFYLISVQLFSIGINCQVIHVDELEAWLPKNHLHSTIVQIVVSDFFDFSLWSNLTLMFTYVFWLCFRIWDSLWWGLDEKPVSSLIISEWENLTPFQSRLHCRKLCSRIYTHNSPRHHHHSAQCSALGALQSWNSTKISTIDQSSLNERNHNSILPWAFILMWRAIIVFRVRFFFKCHIFDSQ